jgi:hypothetical protein
MKMGLKVALSTNASMGVVFVTHSTAEHQQGGD